MPTLIGPPMQPPNTPLLTGKVEDDIKIIMSYINDLVSFLYEYRPTVEAP